MSSFLLTPVHDWRLFALTDIIGLCTSLVVISLYQRARSKRASAHLLWIGMTATVGAFGIWSSSFLGLLDNRTNAAIGYNVGRIALSFIAVALIAGIGLTIGRRPGGWRRVGGALLGLGIVATPYLQIWAFAIPGRIAWSPSLVLCSIAFGVGLAMAPLAIAADRDDVRTTLTSVLLLGLAITLALAAAWSAVDIVASPGQLFHGLPLPRALLVTAITGACSTVLGVCLACALMDRLLALRTLQLNVALNNMSQGLIMFDEAQRVVLCNERYIQLYGLSPEIVKPGCALIDLVRHRAERGRFTRDPQEYHDELPIKLANTPRLREVMEFDDGLVVANVTQRMPGGGWVATHEDITEWTRREASFRLLFNKNPVPMWVADRLTLRFLAVNEAATDHYGYSGAQFAAMSLPDIQPGADADEIRELIMGRGAPADDAGRSWQHLRADGTRLEVVIYARPMRYDHHDALLVAAVDVTARVRAVDELRQTREFLDTVIENVPASIFVKDATDLRYVLVNRAGAELHGISREDMIGRTPRECLEQVNADRIIGSDQVALQSGEALTCAEIQIQTAARGTRLVTARVLPIGATTETPRYLLTVVEDITERRLAEQRILHLAHHDPLTDLPNRAALNEHLASVLDHARSSGEAAAVLWLDLDRFKEINDVFGHQLGDALLCQVSARLRAGAGDGFLARLGGDEFLLVTTDAAQPSRAAALAERLLAMIAEPVEIAGHSIRTGLSIGVAVFPKDGDDAATLLANADAALYRAKAAGRGAVRFFETEMDMRLRDRRALQQDLQSALATGQIVLHYQPLARIGGEIVGFEALARWRHPSRGAISPETFIPIAEESGLIIALGENVLRDACREAVSWQWPLQIAINLSPVQFQHGDLPGLVHSILLQTGLAPSRLELEITEGVLIDDFARAMSVLRRLKSLGVRVVMDDFGAGYSSLRYLQSFPFDKIKIDRAFVSNVDTNPQSAAIVRTVVALGRALDLRVAAEGVETEAQRAFLAREGCEEIQGYLIGRPAMVEDYGELTGCGGSPAARARAAVG